MGGRLGRLLHRPSWPGRALGYCGAVVVTTVVVTIGTDPFSIYHFHHIALYSPLANVIAVPLSAVWTLPWGVVACLLMPFGLERLALVPMGWGIDATISVAEHVSGLPGNVWPMPRLPAAGLALVAIGGLWLCLWHQPWRHWGARRDRRRPRRHGVHAAARHRHRRSRPLSRGAPPGGLRDRRHGEEIEASLLAEETGVDLAAWPGDRDQRPLTCAAIAARATEEGRNRHRGGRPADRLRRRRRDRRANPGGFDCRGDPGRRPHRHLALRRDGVWLDGQVTLESANDPRGDRPWVPHPQGTRARRGCLTCLIEPQPRGSAIWWRRSAPCRRA